MNLPKTFNAKTPPLNQWAIEAAVDAKRSYEAQLQANPNHSYAERILETISWINTTGLDMLCNRFVFHEIFNKSSDKLN